MELKLRGRAEHGSYIHGVKKLKYDSKRING
jgi:hypothetical protein